MSALVFKGSLPGSGVQSTVDGCWGGGGMSPGGGVVVEDGTSA